MGGLTDRSRRPYRQANRLPFQVEKLIVQLKKEHPTWGAPKIREKVRRRHSEITLPAISTPHLGPRMDPVWLADRCHQAVTQRKSW